MPTSLARAFCLPTKVDTLGSFHEGAATLFHEAALIKAKFSQAEYDENTWSTRTWLSFAVQQVSVALHKAVAREIEQELGGARERGCKARGVSGGVAGSE